MSEIGLTQVIERYLMFRLSIAWEDRQQMEVLKALKFERVDMARFTQNDQEVIHLVELEKNSPIFGIVSITFKNGIELEGVIRGASSGNNYKNGMQRPTAYWSETTIQSIDGTMHSVDLLDVQKIDNVWEQRKAAYRSAGIITAAGW